MIKKLTLITILLLGNIAFSQEPKLIEKYFLFIIFIFTFRVKNIWSNDPKNYY